MSTNGALFERLIISLGKKKVISNLLDSFERKEKSMCAVLEETDKKQKSFLQREVMSNIFILFLIIFLEALILFYIIKEL